MDSVEDLAWQSPLGELIRRGMRRLAENGDKSWVDEKEMELLLMNGAEVKMNHRSCGDSGNTILEVEFKGLRFIHVYGPGKPDRLQ